MPRPYIVIGMDGQRVARPVVLGAVVDDQTRCTHHHGPYDVIAIKFRCCGHFYPCYHCHDEAVDHPVQRWPVTERDREAILCGACGSVLTISKYLESSQCPGCSATFNERCSLHHHRYFETVSDRTELTAQPSRPTRRS